MLRSTWAKPYPRSAFHFFSVPPVSVPPKTQKTEVQTAPRLRFHYTDMTNSQNTPTLRPLGFLLFYEIDVRDLILFVYSDLGQDPAPEFPALLQREVLVQLLDSAVEEGLDLL